MKGSTRKWVVPGQVVVPGIVQESWSVPDLRLVPRPFVHTLEPGVVRADPITFAI